ncbi:uncharacterized protein LOC131890471 [Tigriopus californicus]|uniref:uncharacterized protein LOC131890471 n=1 Tax=Tigriopus californicus TaxID=6832 RepID=UPI0027DA6904|nr:uncharacterized protein LOC131890471 [Tigriopus californicus]
MFQWDPSVTSSMHQIHTHGFQAPPNSTPLLQGVNHTNSVQVTVGQQNPHMGPDFQSNPYLQHMIDNYSNMYQNHRGGMGGGLEVDPGAFRLIPPHPPYLHRPITVRVARATKAPVGYDEEAQTTKRRRMMMMMIITPTTTTTARESSAISQCF